MLKLSVLFVCSIIFYSLSSAATPICTHSLHDNGDALQITFKLVSFSESDSILGTRVDIPKEIIPLANGKIHAISDAFTDTTFFYRNGVLTITETPADETHATYVTIVRTSPNLNTVYGIDSRKQLNWFLKLLPDFSDEEDDSFICDVQNP